MGRIWAYLSSVPQYSWAPATLQIWGSSSNEFFLVYKHIELCQVFAPRIFQVPHPIPHLFAICRMYLWACMRVLRELLKVPNNAKAQCNARDIVCFVSLHRMQCIPQAARTCKLPTSKRKFTTQNLCILRREICPNWAIWKPQTQDLLMCQSSFSGDVFVPSVTLRSAWIFQSLTLAAHRLCGSSF